MPLRAAGIFWSCAIVPPSRILNHQQNHPMASPTPAPQRPINRPAQSAGPRPPLAPPEGGDGLITITTRNTFYKEGYSSLLKVAVVQGLIILVLALLVIYKAFIEPPSVRYFATTDDGRIIDARLFSLDNPNLGDPAVLSWASQATTDILTFNFQDYQMRLQGNSTYFTSAGWDGFLKALQGSRLLEGMKANQQLMAAVPYKAPVIVDKGVINGQFYWRIQLPIMTSTVSGDKKSTKTQLLNLMVVRVSPLQNPAALGIEQWVQSDCSDACR